MKKQLRFLYRYFIASHRWRKLFNRQSALVLISTLVFLTTMSWMSLSPADSENPRLPAGRGLGRIVAMEISSSFRQATPNPTQPAIRVEPTRTPFPPEFYENADQTVGITLAGALLVLIVVLGVLTLMPRKK